MRLLCGLAFVLLLALGCTEDSQGDATAPAAPVDYPTTIAVAHTQQAAETASVATPPPGSPSEPETLQGLLTALVSRVIDGDTVELGDGSRVRYIGMDTPETAGDCYNREATARNIELVLNRVVQLEKDVSETDQYGRLLRYVYVDGVMVNEVLVREGYA
jgi:endonuclease YncB( thermonuclease family)